MSPLVQRLTRNDWPATPAQLRRLYGHGALFGQLAAMRRLLARQCLVCGGPCEFGHPTISRWQDRVCTLCGGSGRYGDVPCACEVGR